LSLLEVKDLCVDFLTSYGDVRAVHNVSFEVYKGETFGIIGESGSGKSVISLAILKLLPHNACISGTIYFNKKNLLTIKSEQMRSIRGKHISLMPQNPAVSLNPVLKNEIQLTEIFEQQKIDKKEGLRKSIDIMNQLYLKDPSRILRLYPHQLSGGMKQRLLAAMALSFHPKLLIADEPTKGMDHEAKKKSIELFMKIKQEHGQTMLVITHDLDLALEICNRVAVMYSGEIVEIDEASKVINSPSHPYTKGLIKALPKNCLIPLDGQSPSKVKLPDGCLFNERCKNRSIPCLKKHPQIKQYNGGWIRCHLHS
jgi:peptide/nickel transport system ATP-binding protein